MKCQQIWILMEEHDEGEYPDSIYDNETMAVQERDRLLAFMDCRCYVIRGPFNVITAKGYTQCKKSEGKP